jgi:hypothetical protein
MRVARAAAELGIETVAIAPEDGASCLHTHRADACAALSGRGVAAYLDVERLVAVSPSHAARPATRSTPATGGECSSRNRASRRSDLCRPRGAVQLLSMIALEIGTAVYVACGSSGLADQLLPDWRPLRKGAVR